MIEPRAAVIARVLLGKNAFRPPVPLVVPTCPPGRALHDGEIRFVTQQMMAEQYARLVAQAQAETQA